MNRRDFIKQNAAVTAGGLSSAMAHADIDPAKTRPSDRPFATCRNDTKLVAMYCSPDEVLHHPEYIDSLQQVLGVNMINVMGQGVCYPSEILSFSPFPVERGHFIGLMHQENDDYIHKCAEILHAREIDMWLYGTGFIDPGVDDRLSAVDFNGRLFRHQSVPRYAIEGGDSALCFQKKSINRWMVTAYSWICGNYDIDALYLGHHRYTSPASYGRLYGCACADCERAAYRLGYDFDSMRSSMLSFRDGLSGLSKERVQLIADSGFTLTDFLQTIDGGSTMLEWLEFRAAAVTDSFSAVNRAIKESTGGRCRFIINTVNPTFSLFVGHDLKSFLGSVSDAYYSMGWIGYHFMANVASWANFLCETVDSLDEGTALEVVYSLIGWNDIDLPRGKIADLHIAAHGKDHRIEEFYQHFRHRVHGLLMHEINRAEMINLRNYPAYQTLYPEYWGRETTERLMDDCIEVGFNGYSFGRQPEPFVSKPKKG